MYFGAGDYNNKRVSLIVVITVKLTLNNANSDAFYILSSVSIPNKDKPCFKLTAVNLQSPSLDSLVSPSDFKTGQAS